MVHIWQQIYLLECTFDYKIKSLQIKMFIGVLQLQYYNTLFIQEMGIWYIPVRRVFANGLEDLCSVPGCVIPKTLKMVLDIILLNTQRYKGTYQG